MAIFLFSLTGLPPLAGFIGKFFLFAAVINKGGAFVLLAVVAIINSVVSLYYYARIVKTMFFDSPEPTDQVVAIPTSSFPPLVILTILTVFFGIYWGPLFDYTNQSLSFFIK